MKKIAAALSFVFVLWVLLSIFPTVAQNPQYPNNMPQDTVVGRLGVGSGPAQAIPIGQLGQFFGLTTINVTSAPFNADPTGIADSTIGIQSAINTVPPKGGKVFLPCGIYKISSTLEVGNGTNGVASTTSGLVLQGDGFSAGQLEGVNVPCVQLFWAGSGSGNPILQINGFLEGWSVQNIAFNCNSISGSVGFRNISGQFGYSLGNSFINCAAGLIETAWSTLPAGFGNVDALQNFYANTTIQLANITGTVGMQLTGTGSNTSYDTFLNTTIVFPGTGSNTGMTGIWLQFTDTNTFINTHILGGWGSGEGSAILFDYTANSSFPTATNFYTLDTGNVTGYANAGSPPTGLGAGWQPHYAYGFSTTNGAVYPSIAGFCAQGPVEIQLCSPTGRSTVSVSSTGSPLNVSTPLTSGANGGAGGSLTLNGATSGSSSFSVSATGSPQYAGTTTNDNAPAGDVGEELFCNAVGSNATVTISIASPAVVTYTGIQALLNFNGLVTGPVPVFFTTTGALPTGLTANTTYYIIPSSISTNSFQIATSIANALSNTAVNTSGTQSGTQTGFIQAFMATTVTQNICAITLTAGDWNIGGLATASGNAATTVTQIIASISSSSATFVTTPLGSIFSHYYGGGTPFTTTFPQLNHGLTQIRATVNAPTTYYLVAQATFATSGLEMWGFMMARRVR